MVPVSPAKTEVAIYRGFTSKRLMGFEPTTFCMAIREVLGASWPSIVPFYRAFVFDEVGHVRCEYA